MPEPEFLPDWYIRRELSRRRRRAALRSAAVVLALAALWLAVSPRTSPSAVAASPPAGGAR